MITIILLFPLFFMHQKPLPGNTSDIRKRKTAPLTGAATVIVRIFTSMIWADPMTNHALRC
ncbi:hypothetical protein [Paenibacillus sp. Y412MC10]|uniref:hypothetical protein n=1 Tax=Geobacillus sp. (strain Y412MC10) TaxID=481743 RepID=UPI00164254E1|nr:hypothetical protein [Paenibacillus sp. Y412MC10]